MRSLFKRYRGFLATLAAGCAVVAVILFVSGCSGRSDSPAPSATQSVQDASPLRSDNPLPPDKQAIQDRLDKIRQDASKLPPPPKPKYFTWLPTATPGPWPEGIFDTGHLPWYTEIYRIKNHWQGERIYGHTAVFAGSRGPENGIVVSLFFPLGHVPGVSGVHIYSYPGCRAASHRSCRRRPPDSAR